MEFDDASVKKNTAGPSSARGSTVPLGPGDVYVLNNGRFRAMNYPLFVYIVFAYKITDSQEQLMLPQLPGWVRSDRFDIQATAHGNPTKDQIRLMMQSLLADRFRLAIHYETRQIPIYALTMDTGKFGPLLQQHDESSTCQTSAIVPSPPPMAPPETRDVRFPAPCGGILGMNPSVPGRIRVGARNITMQLFAESIGGSIDGAKGPVLDKTGLTGRFDFAIEYTAESSIARGKPTDSSAALTFRQALKEQLGLNLEPEIGSLDVPVVDDVEPLSD